MKSGRSIAGGVKSCKVVNSSSYMGGVVKCGLRVVKICKKTERAKKVVNEL